MEFAQFRLPGVLLCLEGVPVHHVPLGHHSACRGVSSMEHVVVKRGELYRRVESRGGGSADEEGSVHPPFRHRPAEFLHLVKRRSNEAAGRDDVSLFPQRSPDYRLPVHHHAEVDDIESVASEHNGSDVLADVVYVSLDGGYDYLRSARGFPGRLRLHVWLQKVHRLLHYLGRLDHLRKKHLSASEEFSDLFHSVHQRPFDDVDWLSSFVYALLKVGGERRRLAFDQCADDAPGGRLSVMPGLLVSAERTGCHWRPGCHACWAGSLLSCGFAAGGLLGDFLRLFDEPFRRAGVGVEYHVLDSPEQIRLDLVIDLEHPRIDNRHIQPGLYGMVEKRRVHGLAHRIVASERERQVGHSA